MEIIYFCGILTLLSATSGRIIDVLPNSTGKQLFLSRHVVTEGGAFDGGVLVDEKGVIEAVLKRDVIISLLAQNLHDLKIIDGGELALMAGGVDSHVHVNEPGRTSWEGYVTATQAAAVGGFTTIIDMPLNSIPPTTTLDNLRVKAAMAKQEVFVDVGFWGGVVPGNEIELHDLVRAGVVGFKCFLTDSGVSEFPNVTPSDLSKVFEVLNGTGTVLAFHAEVSLNTTDKECTTECPNPILFDTYLATHPEEMELKAVSLVTSFLPQTDVHVHIVHVSAEGVVPILEAAREARIKSGYVGWRGGVTAETCHHYLTLSSEQIPPGRTEYKCSPPIRNNTNKQKLWEYIKDGRLDLIASDHSPSVQDLKGANFLKAWGGISSVQFGISLFWTEAKARGYDLSTVSHYLSAGPARLAGLQDRKGAIRPGLDADLILFDPNASFIVTPEVIRYKNKISPYMNRVLNGVVRRTYLRGQLIYADGELVGEPKGNLLLTDEMIEDQKPRREEIGPKSRKNETHDLPRLDKADGIQQNSSRHKNILTTEAGIKGKASENRSQTSQEYDQSKNISNPNNEMTTIKYNQTEIHGKENKEHSIVIENRHITTTTEKPDAFKNTTESVQILDTNIDQYAKNITNNITVNDSNNLTTTTTQEPNVVQKWINNIMSGSTNLKKDMTLILGLSLVTILTTYIK